MPGKVTYKFYDWDKELSTTGLRTPTLHSGNIAAYTTLFNTWGTALDGVTIGWRFKRSVLAEETFYAGTYPAQGAQRENKWLVLGNDTTYGNPQSVSIPTPDLSILTGNSNELDLSGGPGLALKDAMEAIWEDNNGNGVAIHTVKFVGRNL